MTVEVSKVTAHHLKRDAYLYIRQSTVRQVFENTESTENIKLQKLKDIFISVYSVLSVVQF